MTKLKMKDFFLGTAEAFGMRGIKAELIGTAPSCTQKTIKITDTFTGREYFVRGGFESTGWVTVKGFSTSRGRWANGNFKRVFQYGVMRLPKQWGKFMTPEEKLFVVERHITKQRKKLGFPNI
jgi:hypothetical protein